MGGLYNSINNMSKQTAVEWLEQEFIALQNYGVNEFGLFAKAKEMEKNQTEKAFCKGFITEGDLVIICEQYIEEIYGGKL
jgi:hypothetical protein